MLIGGADIIVNCTRGARRCPLQRRLRGVLVLADVPVSARVAPVSVGVGADRPHVVGWPTVRPRIAARVDARACGAQVKILGVDERGLGRQVGAGATAAIPLAGPSEIRNPHGKVIATTTNYRDYVTASVNLDCKLVHMDDNGKKLKALKQRYQTQVDIYDPGHFGSVLVTSESESINAENMLKEFKIEPLDDYLQRSLNFHQQPQPG